MNPDEIRRQAAKTREQRFLNLMEQEFNYPPKIAQAILAEAQACLLAESVELQPGQRRVILPLRQIGHGRKIGEIATKEVTWTIDAGPADRQILQKGGPIALRQARLQRLLQEAVAQGVVANQEDLAHALHVSVRTIKRDCAALQAQGISLPTRGHVHSIGRGQTHKMQIISHWLRGQTYDQIARRSHHSLTSVKRYIQCFVRVVELSQRGMTAEEVALTLQIGISLVGQYLQIYQENDTPFCRRRLNEQLERLNQNGLPPKKGVS